MTDKKLHPGAICLECKHCIVTTEEGAYGEDTPATPWLYRCYEVQHYLSGANADKPTLLAELRTAETCDRFDPEKP